MPTPLCRPASNLLSFLVSGSRWGVGGGAGWLADECRVVDHLPKPRCFHNAVAGGFKGGDDLSAVRAEIVELLSKILPQCINHIPCALDHGLLLWAGNHSAGEFHHRAEIGRAHV